MQAGASLVWACSQSDEPSSFEHRWFEHRVPVPALAESQTTEVDLQHWEVDGDLTVADTVLLSIRLVSELDGVDEELLNGSITARAIDGASSFEIDNDWLLGIALLALDVVDEFDAPKLAVTMFLKGAVDDYQLEAHCFYNGTRFAKASDVETRYTFTASDGSVVGREVVALFDGVRGWNNLSDSGWGGEWHLLDAHDGGYEVKLLRDSQVARVVAFAVEGGRIVVPEGETVSGRRPVASGVEFSPEFGAVIITTASVQGDLDGEWNPTGATPFYGDSSTGVLRATIDDVYAQRVAQAPPAGHAAALDDETTAALQAYLDRVERLLATWESELIGTAGPFDYSQVLAAEAVLRERAGYDELAAAVHPVPDALAPMRDRMLALFAAAETRIAAAAGAQHDELAPYRVLLSGDKLAIFDEHPANTFAYTTIGGRSIRAPEELAAAEYWFFEGPTDVPSTATVEGVDVRVTVRGWRVRGWRFDSSGAIVDSVELSGPGQSAPSSAFRPFS